MGRSGKRIAALVLCLLLLVGCAGPTAVSTTTRPATPAPTATSVAPNCGDTTAVAAAAPASLIPYTVIDRFPHDVSAFTQGLQLVDGVLYEGTGKYGDSDVRRVEPASGRVLQQRPLDDAFFGEGITLFDGRLYQLTWQEQTAFVYDPADFSLLQTFRYDGQGWGLTHNGRCLIMSDGSSTLTFRDPQTFAVLGQLVVMDGETAVSNLNELEYINGRLYANVWQTDRIAVIAPDSGRVTGWLDLTPIANTIRADYPDANVLNGIAYDVATGHLLVTGKYWPFLYEIALMTEE